ncbi:hypothetical protein VTO73DRAFT_1634 [Trametes versicolor]
MVKQWLHQYGQGLSGNPGDVARLRQYRYDSLIKWHVPGIIAFLPILLQTALALFLGGLLILLYSLHQAVAVTVSFLVGGLIIFTTATTILPTYFSDCCYQSPQALSVCIAIQVVRQALIETLDFIERKTESWLNDAGLLHYAVRSSLGKFQSKATFRSWQAREKPDVDALHDELDQAVALTTYRIISDNAVLTSTVVPCLSGVNALSERMSVQYGDLLVSIVEKLKKSDWALWRPIMPFILVVLSLIVKDPRPGAVRRVLSVMPEHRLTSAKSNLTMLFLLSMTNLVSNGIAARDAFEVILRYLRDAQVSQERSTTLGQTVLADVEAAFPGKWDALEQVVDLNNYVAISNYLTGLEHIVRYLLRHRATLGELLLPVEERIRVMLLGFECFLRFPAWPESTCRQQSLLWALVDSTLPDLVWELRRPGAAATVVLQKHAAKCATAYRGVGELLVRDLSTPEHMRSEASGVTRKALGRLAMQLERFSKEDEGAKAPDRVQKGSNTLTVVDSQPSSGDKTTLVPSRELTHPPESIPSGPLPPLPSAQTQQDTDPGVPADDEMDVADISYILDMGIYWDEMPHTPGIDTRRLSEVAMVSPAIRDEVDDWRADPVLPSVAETNITPSPNAHVIPILLESPEAETVFAGS